MTEEEILEMAEALMEYDRRDSESTEPITMEDVRKYLPELLEGLFYIQLKHKFHPCPYMWQEGGIFVSEQKAEFQAKQIRKMRRYEKVKVLPL